MESHRSYEGLQLMAMDFSNKRELSDKLNEAFMIQLRRKERFVCKLNKTLYNLNQVPRAFKEYSKINAFFKNKGLKKVMQI